jgi:hypothetical protein
MDERTRRYRATAHGKAVIAAAKRRYRARAHGKARLAEADKRYYATEKGKQARSRKNRRHLSTPIGKMAARAQGKGHYAVRCGVLPHPSLLSCRDCDAPAVAYDHRDYAHPLTVEPVCHRCNVRRGGAIQRYRTP